MNKEAFHKGDKVIIIRDSQGRKPYDVNLCTAEVGRYYYIVDRFVLLDGTLVSYGISTKKSGAVMAKGCVKVENIRLCNRTVEYKKNGVYYGYI